MRVRIPPPKHGGAEVSINPKPSSNGQTVVVAAAAVSFDGRVLITSSDQPQIAELIKAPTRTASKRGEKIGGHSGRVAENAKQGE